MYAAAFIRYRTPVSHLRLLQEELGPLWPRAGMFAVIVVLCLLAFGLYSAQQRTQLSGMLVRLGAALLVATCALAAIFYLLPSLQLWRGVEALAVLITGLWNPDLAAGVRARGRTRRSSSVGCWSTGPGAAAAVAALRRSSDRRGFRAGGFRAARGRAARRAALSGCWIAQGDLRELCERLNVTEVVVAMDDRRRAFPSSSCSTAAWPASMSPSC